MKIWNDETGFHGSEIPVQVSQIAETLRALLPHGIDRPTLRGIGKRGEDDGCRYRVDLEVAPGLTLSTEYGSSDGLNDGSEDELEDVRLTVDAVLEGHNAAFPRRHALAETVHMARVQARRIVSAWGDNGVPTRVIDVLLAPYDHWRGREVPALYVVVEMLSETLEPTEITISVVDPDRLEEELATWRDHIASAYASRARLSRMGATGTVSRLALNAMSHFGEIGAFLRRFGGEWRFWLPDDTALIMMGGHVSVSSGDPEAKYDWWDGHVNVRSLFTPLSDMLDFVGKPLTTLLDHEYVSDEMIVTGASTSVDDDGCPIVSIEFTNPTLLFCSISGRAWTSDQCNVPAAARSAPAERGSNVIQFPKRARALCA